MRRLCVQLSFGLLLTMPLVGCNRAEGQRVATESIPEARHPSTTPAPQKNSGPIEVRVKYHVARGPCIHGEDGSWEMPTMDSFKVVEVIKGRVKATFIYVRPLSPQGPAYPKNLVEGDSLTLRLNLSDDSREQVEENERKGNPWLIVDGSEVEQTTTPGPSPRPAP